MNFWQRDLHRIALAAGQPVVAQVFYLPRPVAIISGDSGAGIILPAIFISCRARRTKSVGIVWRIGFEGQAAQPRLLHDPVKRNVGQRIIRIAAADIGVHAREPDLTQAFVLNPPHPIRISWSGTLASFAPKHRMKGRAFIIDRKSMARSLNLRRQNSIRQFERPNPFADTASHFLNRRYPTSP
jgi:hypothetical protein